MLLPSELRCTLLYHTLRQNYWYVEKILRNFQFGKKSAKVFHCLYSSIEQLLVALWTYMFLKLGLNKEKSIHTLSLQSLHLQTLCLVSLVNLITKTKRTSGFWPHVRACALRAPIFLGSLPRPTGRCVPPPRPSQLRCFLFTPQNFHTGLNSGRQGCVYLSIGLSCTLRS